MAESERTLDIATGDLDIFAPALVERSVAATRTDIIATSLPLPSSDINSTIDFRIPAIEGWFIDPSPCILEIELKVIFNETADADKQITSRDKVGLVNHVLPSLFSAAELSVNNVVISPPSQGLPWIRYLNAITAYGYETRQSWLRSAGWYDDTSSDISKGVENPNSIKRMEKHLHASVGRYMGEIPIAFFDTECYIPPNTEIGIKLYRNRPEFLVMYTQPAAPAKQRSFQIVIEKCYIHVKRVRVHDNILAAIQRKHKIMPTRYDFTEVQTRALVLPKEVHALDTEIYNGVSPSKISIVQFSQSALAGSIDTNPYNFLHANLTGVQLSHNGAVVGEPLKTNFSKGDVQRLYLNYLKNSGCLLRRSGQSFLDLEAFCNGYAILNYNLTHFDECSRSFRSPQEHGVFRLKLDYDASVKRDHALVIMILFTFTRTLFLHADGTVEVQ